MITALIGIDWGSSSVRAFRIAPDGTILETRRAADGVFTGQGPYQDRLRALLGDWRDAPILLCGMIGSDRGWVHAPYVEAPATLDLKPVAAPFDDAHIVPGIAFVDGETCDVMRGEETLLAGLDAPDAVVCLPGTHSKWATLESGRLTRFRTYMTGEIRAAMLASGAFATGVEQAASPGAFAQGLHAAGPVTAALFQARARRLLGKLAPEHTASFVDGVLIGAEIADAPAHAVTLVAAGPIAGQYKSALAGRIGAVVDPEPLAARGLLRIARRAGLV